MNQEIQSISEIELAALLHRVARLLGRMAQGHDGGSHAQERVYAMIREQGPVLQRELMNRLGVRSASLSEVLAKLERAGRITRVRDEEDKRGLVVMAVESGEPEEVRLPHGIAHARIFSCLEREEQAQLATLLGKLLATLEQESSCACGNTGTGHRRHGCAGKGKHGLRLQVGWKR